MRKLLATVLTIDLIIILSSFGLKSGSLLICIYSLLVLAIIFNALIVNRISSNFIIYSSIILNLLSEILLLAIYLFFISFMSLDDIIAILIMTLIIGIELVLISKILITDAKKMYKTLNIEQNETTF